MVADVSVALARTASVRVEIAGDLGARAIPLDGASPGAVTLRVRGLAPDRDHAAEVVLTDGASEQRLPLEFRTPPPLAGFVEQFAVTGAGAADYRVFDHSTTPKISDSGLFAVDAAGRTRFYLSSPSSLEEQLHVRPPAGVKLLDDGTLLYAQDNRLRIVDELGETLLDVDPLSLGVGAFHHDALRLPGGNLLVLAHEFGSFVDPASGQAGLVAGDRIVELSPDGNKVWEWSSFDHLDTERIPGPDYYVAFVEDAGSGQTAHDWTHGNGIVYRAEDDSILLSLRHQDWVLKIDHATGDVLWRLGKDGDFTLASGSWFFHQHSPEWQADGSLLLYDNGAGNPDLPVEQQRSRPVRYVLDEASKTATQVWEETQESYLSLIAGDADALPGGTVRVLDSSLLIDPTKGFSFDIYSRLREVEPDSGEWLWTLRSDDHRFIYRCIASDRLPGEPAK